MFNLVPLTGTGRKLGITGEIGEVLVCKKLGLKLLANPVAAGFDAVDKNGKRYQIKTRRAEQDKGRLSKFSNHEFDYAVLAILGQSYEIKEVWQTNYEKLKPLIDKEKRSNPSVVTFKKIARQIA